MKYLNKLFAFDDRQSNQRQSSAATLTSNLYSVTFISEQSNNNNNSRNQQNNHSNREEQQKQQQQQPEEHLSLSLSSSSSSSSSTSRAASSPSSSSASARIAFKRQQISVISGNPNSDLNNKPVPLIDNNIGRQPRTQTTIDEKGLEARRAPEEGEQTGILGYLLAATIGKTLAKQYNLTTSKAVTTPSYTIDRRKTHATKDRQNHSEDLLLETKDVEEDDWILLDDNNKLPIDHTTNHPPKNNHITTNTISNSNNINSNNNRSSSSSSSITYKRKSLTQSKQQMALDKPDIDLIKASWVPVRKDTTASGVLLFKMLFVKFPQYLKFFPQFSDLDLDRMHEDKRLLRHAVKVIETVTFVVDAIGDESKTSQLNDALVKLVKSHLKRRIGTPEFRNLGIVLIDFICDVAGRGGATAAPEASLHLVAAWTKLYNIILDLVRREEAAAAANTTNANSSTVVGE